ncbi:MAG: hypothetical protein GF355_16045 [Candidatus Eisenbacteria bacterium]|nr:hypothetical protein [Candidatus Eisenbacteria bacterium]
MDPAHDVYRDILRRTTGRYLTVRPRGLVISPRHPPLPILHVRILDHGAARTLYHQRQPVCRSLDAVKPLKNPQVFCTDCSQRRACTPQVRVDLTFEHAPYRLLLAYTSAKNFLLYNSTIAETGRGLCDVMTQIQVVNRGNWGELRFSLALK